jgi:hypothetical protein
MNKILGIIILSLFTISCSSNLDFNQVNDLKTTPVIVANLATFDVPASQFVIGGVEQPVSGDLLNFDVFKDNYFNNSLVKAEMYFEITNTINRAYKIDLYFLDDSNNTVYTIPFNVPAQGVATKTEVFVNSNLDLLKKTTKIGFVVTMYPGPALTANSTGSLKLRSSATVYLNQQ